MARPKKTATPRPKKNSIEYWSEPARLDRLTAYKAKGKSNAEVAKIIGIAPRTLSNWIDKDPVIAEAIRFGRDMCYDKLESKTVDILANKLGQPQVVKSVLTKRYNENTGEWEDYILNETTVVESHTEQVKALASVMRYHKPTEIKAEIELKGEGFDPGQFTTEDLIAMANMNIHDTEDDDNG